jgi:hypothetical protein
MWNHTWIEWIINLGKYLMNMGGFFSDIIIMEGIFFIDLDDKVHEDFLNRMKTDTEHLSDDISPLVRTVRIQWLVFIYLFIEIEN